MADFSELYALLSKRNQRFICTDLGWPEPGPERFTAHIRHEAAPPLDAGTLEKLRDQLPEVPRLVEFYARFGSLRLYCDTVFHPAWEGYSSAFYIAHPDEWEDLKLGFQAWLEDLSEKEKAELLPAWLDDAVVIGEVSNSGNYFLVPLGGPECGAVFEFEHDGFEFIQRGESIDAFIASLSVVTDELLHEIAGHTRYFDGKTDMQWLVERYEFDAPVH